MVKYRGKEAKYYELAKEAKYWGVSAKYCTSTGLYKGQTCCVSGGNWGPRDNAVGGGHPH